MISSAVFLCLIAEVTFNCVIYQGISSCGNNYIGETIRNTVTRIDEHEQPNGNSKPSKHIKNNSDLDDLDDLIG